MDKSVELIEVMAAWCSQIETPPLIFASCNRGRSFNTPRPIMGVAYHAIGQYDWWEYGGIRRVIPNRHVNVGWAHEGAQSAPPKKDVAMWSIAFDVAGIKIFDEIAQEPPPPTVYLENAERICAAYQLVATLFLLRSKTAPLRLKAALLNLFAVLLEELEATAAAQKSTYNDAVQEALAYIHSNFTDPLLMLEDVARVAKLNAHHFGRCFRQATGQTPMKYVQELRIEHGQRLLNVSDLSVAEIARECGFRDPLYFSRAFRQATGCAPSQYREAGSNTPNRAS